jgi:hypothetical protein
MILSFKNWFNKNEQGIWPLFEFTTTKPLKIFTDILYKKLITN